MARRFKVSFPPQTTPSPRIIVYISPSKDCPNYFSISILHAVSSTGTFDPDSGINIKFELEQNVTRSEQEAQNWAITWLNKKYDCDDASLNEVTA